MPLTADQYQTLIVTEVNDVGDLVANNIDTLWTLYDTQTDLYIRYLYSKRKAIDLLMGSVREQVNRAGINGIRADLSDNLPRPTPTRRARTTQRRRTCGVSILLTGGRKWQSSCLTPPMILLSRMRLSVS
jgi:hypothetical protein